MELEIIVADGGSSDDTCALARAHGAAIITAPRGRAAQMNAGARAASAERLLFLHADSGLNSQTLLTDALAAYCTWPEPRSAGHFALRFIGTTPGHELFYRHLEAKTRLNRPGTINGDQGLLISRAYFNDLGGYDESLPFLEDQRIAAKIFAGGHWLLLPGELQTSARRFEREGHAARYTLMAMLMGLHAADVHEFFAEAPQVYRAQSEARALDLRPFMALARKALRRRGIWKTLWPIGRYVRGNSWQLFFARDIGRTDGRLRCLEFHDRHLAAALDNRYCDALATLLLAAWFYLYLPLKVKT